jgi:uncharacterized DUF497 family protein
MDVEHDPEKDAINQTKHGVPLALGVIVLENSIGEVVDDRRDYGEAPSTLLAWSRDGCSFAPTRCAERSIG